LEIRAYRGTDEAELLALWNASMTHDRISEAIFRTRVLLDPNFRADKLQIAVDDGRLVGFVLVITRQVPFFLQGLEPEKAWSTASGVHPDYCRLQIGRLLLFRCLATMSARQIYYAYFLWTGEEAARLYALAGFRKRREFAIFRKNLTTDSLKGGCGN
jgi:mycothiol synthase